MRKTQGAVLSCGIALAIALLPRSAAAQGWDEPWSDPRDRPARVDVSLSPGWLMPTDWSDLVLLGRISPISGVLEQVLVRDIRVEPDNVFDAAVTYWRGAYGLRVQGGLSRSSLTIGGSSLEGAPRETLPTDINSWFYDVRGAIGLVPYSPTRNVWPYAFVGLGGITYDLSRTITPPLVTFAGGATGWQSGPGSVIVEEDGGRAFLIAVDELGLETVFAFSFGLGSDFRLPFGGGGLGLRLEVSDHIAESPLKLRIRELDAFGGLARDDAVDFGAVHHLRAAVGLVLQFGR